MTLKFDKAVRELAFAVARKTPHADFSLADMDRTLCSKLSEPYLVNGKVDYYKWMETKNEVFAIIAEMLNEALPIRLEQSGLGDFIDIRNFNHGDKVRFLLKAGRKNVRRFITKVSAAGVYDRVRLDKNYVDIETYAHGGAIYQTMETFLASGEGMLTEVLEIMLDELEDSIYVDVATALKGATSAMPAANQATDNVFDPVKFNKVLATVRTYGQPNIFCTQEFAATMAPTGGYFAVDRDEVRNQGYIGRYNGAPLIILPQTFLDETNEVKAIDPGFAYILPSGADEAPIKLGFEGDTVIRDVQNADWSFEMQLYKKFGIVLAHANHFGIYENTAL